MTKELEYVIDKLNISNTKNIELRRRIKWISNKMQKPAYVLRVTEVQYYREIHYENEEDDD